MISDHLKPVEGDFSQEEIDEGSKFRKIESFLKNP